MAVGVCVLAAVIIGPWALMFLSTFDQVGIAESLCALIFWSLYFAACITAIGVLIDIAREKGHFRQKGARLLWFVGLFATPITLALLVIALPDSREELIEIGSDSITDSDLPSF